MPQLRPPSSDRNQLTPAAHTRSGSRGSTAMTLMYHPMLVKSFWNAGLQSPSVAPYGLVSSSVLSLFESRFVVRASQERGSPPAADRYTASSPCRKFPPGPPSLLAASA